jgi:beta-lactamase superfamily II metal-dependent hydrolase
LHHLLPFLVIGLATSLPAQELEIRFLDVGQGDATLIIGPTGTNFLVDGGPNGEGNATVVPLLQFLGITQLDYVSNSHYHADHLGGLDEVWNAGIQTTVCFDRGLNQPPTTNSYNDYALAYSSVRQTAYPGQVIDLGGGATATCLVVEGQFLGGTSVDISASAQFENSASIAWRIEYGDFDMYVGGDLTGGGNSTTDVEGLVGPICGDIEVLRVSHHGSRTSTQPNFLAEVNPGFAIISCGAANQFGFPRQDTIDNLNRFDWAIPVWATTNGNGGLGFIDAGGMITLRTDGNTYQVTAASGANFRAHCDEQAPPTTAQGQLVVSEFMRNPSKVADDSGEWLELAGTRQGAPVSVVGIEVRDDSGDQFRLQSTIILDAGESLAIGAKGLPSANGGFTPAIAWPSGSMLLSNTSDVLELNNLATGASLDRIVWDTSWPGNTAISAERMDLLRAPMQDNFSESTSNYGLGDRGTPGLTNDNDTTNWGGSGRTPWIDILSAPSVGGFLDMNWYMPGDFGSSYQGWITLGLTPGFDVAGTHIYANMDKFYTLTSPLPGWAGIVPASEVVRASTPVPNNSVLAGVLVYAVLVTYDPPNQIRAQADPIAMIIF